jgi:hypothetical protein
MCVVCSLCSLFVVQSICNHVSSTAVAPIVCNMLYSDSLVIRGQTLSDSLERVSKIWRKSYLFPWMRSMSWPALLTIAEMGWLDHSSSVNCSTHLYDFLWVIHFSVYFANCNVNLGGFDHFWSQKCDCDTLFTKDAAGTSSQHDYTLIVQWKLNAGNSWDVFRFAWQYSRYVVW